MKCNLVQAGQTIDSKVSFGKGGLLSSSHVWTFRPIMGHRNIAFAISLQGLLFFLDHCAERIDSLGEPSEALVLRLKHNAVSKHGLNDGYIGVSAEYEQVRNARPIYAKHWTEVFLFIIFAFCYHRERPLLK
jgi:hypothetical protein